jgi:hypothetical protein
MTFPYRLAAIDLDDTLLGHDKSISPENARAAATLRSLGVIIVLCSGRRHESMLLYHRELGLSGYIISAQGAIVRHAETNETLLHHKMPPHLACRIVAEGDRHDFTVLSYEDAGVFAPRETSWIDLYRSNTRGVEVHVRPLELFSNASPEKIIWTGDPDRLHALTPLAHQQFGHESSIVTTCDQYLEFSPANINKQVGLSLLADHLRIPREQVLAFGDGNNDAPMLAWAGLGIAMDHATEEAKRSADMVVPEGDPETSFGRGVRVLLAQYGVKISAA